LYSLLLGGFILRSVLGVVVSANFLSALLDYVASFSVNKILIYFNKNSSYMIMMSL